MEKSIGSLLKQRKKGEMALTAQGDAHSRGGGIQGTVRKSPRPSQPKKGEVGVSHEKKKKRIEISMRLTASSLGEERVVKPK